MQIKLLKNLLLASLLMLPLVTQAGTKFTYYVNDALGSPVVAMDEAGDVIWRKTYEPYGKSSGNDGDNRIGYTGHVEDQPDLVYAGARYYDPTLGRFLSDDPVRFTENNPMSFNRYAYANNNPYKYVDPDGGTAYDVEVARRIAVATQTDLHFPSSIDLVDFANPVLQNLFGVNKTTAGLTNPGQWTKVSERYYGGDLDDKQAANLLDTVIHEGVHYSLKPDDPKQEDGKLSGYPYDQAKERTTKALIDRFNKERKIISDEDRAKYDINTMKK